MMMMSWQPDLLPMVSGCSDCPIPELGAAPCGGRGTQHHADAAWAGPSTNASTP